MRLLLLSLVLLLPRLQAGEGDVGRSLETGNLLVASEKLGDPNFREAVILLVQFRADEGAIGLVINRRTEVLLSELFRGGKTRRDPMYEGGPVDVRAMQALLRADAEPKGALHLFGDVYATASKSLIEKSVKGKAEPSRFRLYLGYAGWQPGQLEAEISIGAWAVLPGKAENVFSENTDSLWSRLHAIANGQIASIERPFGVLARR